LIDRQAVTSGEQAGSADLVVAPTAIPLTPAQYAELIAVIGLANETNRIAVAHDVPLDKQFR
jgi:alkylhydroperoxidase family enzyme